MLILDVSMLEIEGPIMVGSTNMLPGLIENMIVQGNYTYLATGQAGLRIWDVSNPVSTYEVGSYSSGNGNPVNFVRVQDDIAYLLQGMNELAIIDLSDRNFPVKLSSIDFDCSGLHFDLAGNYLYIGQDVHFDAGKLVIWDISNKQSPVEVSSLSLPKYHSFSNVVVEDNFVYLQLSMDGLLIVNIADPSQPNLHGAYHSPWAGGGDSVKSGNYLFVAQHWQGIEIIDISDPNEPYLISSITPEGASDEITIDGNYAYIACDDIGLCVLNISDPLNPTLIFEYKLHPVGVVGKVIQQGTYLYYNKFMNGLGVVDLDDPQFREIGAYPPYGDNRFLDPTIDLAVYDDYAYLGQCTQIEIVNIHDVQNIYHVTEYPIETRCYYKMKIQGNLLFILDNESSQITVLDQHTRIAELSQQLPPGRPNREPKRVHS